MHYRKKGKVKKMINVTHGTEKFRDTMFNTTCIGRAYELLRHDLMTDFARLQSEMHFRYLRCHALFHDDMAVARRKKDGKVAYQWHHIDKFVDNMLSIGLKPFFELNATPECMASDKDQRMFAYGANVSNPTDWNEWGDLVRAFTSHMVDRYGLDEVRTWYFEVWNEPNLRGFWYGTQDEYFTLYKYAAEAVKSVDSLIRIGGPATAGAAWLDDMIEYCYNNAVPLDFVTTHVYPIGEYCEYPNRKGSPYAPGDYMPAFVAAAEKVVRESKMPDLEIHWTEWNTQYGKDDGRSITWTNNPTVDMHFAAASIVKNMLATRNMYDSMAYWVVSDLFEECGCPHSPFSCTYGLMNIHGIPKASYNAYRFLRKLRGNVMPTETDGAPFGCDAFFTEENGISRGIVWNWKAMEIDDQPDWEDKVRIPVPEEGEYTVTTAAIRRHRGSAYETWISMGMPQNLSKTQQEMLEAHSMPEYDFMTVEAKDGYVEVPFMLEPNDVMYIEAEKKGEVMLPRSIDEDTLARWNDIMTLEEKK